LGANATPGPDRCAVEAFLTKAIGDRLRKGTAPSWWTAHGRASTVFGLTVGERKTAVGVTDDDDIRLEATCETARIEVRVTPGGVSISEHPHTEAHVGRSEAGVAAGCDDARAQAEMLVALWGAERVAAAAMGESRELGQVAYRLAEPLTVEYSITTDSGTPEESIRRLDAERRVHVVIRNDVETGGNAVVHGPYDGVAAALEANPSAVRSDGDQATITCDYELEVLLLDLLHGAEFEQLVVNDVPWIESDPSWLPDTDDDPGNLSDRLEEVERWDNEDDDDFPGGDRLSELARWGHHYFTYDDWEGWSYLGRYADQAKAVRDWARKSVPGGLKGLKAYKRRADD
jgi:hypothetical protein